MAKAKAQAAAERPAEIIKCASSATTSYNSVRLSELDHQTYRHLYCHREQDSLAFGDDADSHMDRMVESLLSEGQQIPVEYYRDERGSCHLIRGFRRISALLHIIEHRLDPARFSLEMEVLACEVTSADPNDYVVRSVADNEVRRNLTEAEQFGAAQLLLSKGVSAPRAARALGMSTTTFRRLHLRILYPDLQRLVTDGCLGQSDIDNLLAVAASHNRVTEVAAELEGVFGRVRAHADRLRATALAAGEEFDEAKQGTLKQYVKPDHTKGWVKAVAEGKSLTWSAEAADGDLAWVCKLDSAEGSLTIGGLRRNLHKLTAAELSLIAFKLAKTAATAERWLQRKLAEEGLAQVTAVADEESYLNYLEKHQATEVATKVRHAIAAAQGETDPNHGRVQPRTETAIANAINVPPVPDLGAAEAAECEVTHDPMIDS